MNKKVSVIAPARLHMGFIDLSGSLGRDFGSVGIALNEISTRLRVSYARQLIIIGPSPHQAQKWVRTLCCVLNVSDCIRIEIETAIPEHIGLGSGTQMALAIGSALNAFYDLGLSIRDIAQLTQRGMRSGIGIGVFEQGGLVVDGGRGALTKTPPIISHLYMPTDWRFILVFDATDQGLHGEQEVKALKVLHAFPPEVAMRLCYLLLMQGLPAVAEHNIGLFGDVITQIQQAIGNHFATVQGDVFKSHKVAEVMHWLSQNGAVAIGQTSWGPTGFCAVDNQHQARELVAQMQQKFKRYKQISFAITSASNGGSTVDVVCE